MVEVGDFAELTRGEALGPSGPCRWRRCGAR
ncbi:lasso RiPP family leader peptide-containing protein [Streptomyces flavofungini]